MQLRLDHLSRRVTLAHLTMRLNDLHEFVEWLEEIAHSDGMTHDLRKLLDEADPPPQPQDDD